MLYKRYIFNIICTLRVVSKRICTFLNRYLIIFAFRARREEEKKQKGKRNETIQVIWLDIYVLNPRVYVFRFPYDNARDVDDDIISCTCMYIYSAWGFYAKCVFDDAPDSLA